jgi:hypothetical protein
MLKQDPLQYRELAAKAVQDKQLHKALGKLRDKFGRNAVNLYNQLRDGAGLKAGRQGRAAQGRGQPGRGA